MELPEVSGEVVAKACNLDIRRVQQLSKQGIIPKVRHGRYDLIRSMSAYIQYLQNLSQGSEDKDQHAERTRLLSAQADKEELTVSKMRGELVSQDAVQAGFCELAATIRTGILSFGARIAPLCAGQNEASTIENIVSKHANELLDALRKIEVEEIDEIDETAEAGETAEPAAPGAAAKGAKSGKG